MTGRRFQLLNRAYGIFHHQGAVYVTSGTALYHYTLTGTLVQKMYGDIGVGNRVLMCALSPAGDRVYVTNYHHLTLAMDATDIYIH
ncbi:hypothetical protein DPMN_182809 [Dreissena polymorpha]|uniref:Uncharacterized protein n=2 Tax=Dreissena polymorpha TaxID=45954 RepID=A0A9D4DH06_DREPO|nr:hypothetical protein DPMN_182809 [Dreissena polymorpha]